MDCSTIIVSYNTFDLTLQAIRTALDSAEFLAHEVIVVDNASPDGSGERLARAFVGDERIHVIQNTDNKGFSTANNQGAAVARGDVLFFLNPDTVVHDSAIPRLVDFIRTHADAGAVGPRVLNEDGSVQPSALEFPSPGWMLRHHFPIASLLQGADRRIDPVPEHIVTVEVVKGCALALSRQAFDVAGGWDESYFMYSEETELCRTLKLAGYVNYHVPDARITHYGGAASVDHYAEEQVRSARSSIDFLKRHYPPSHVLLYQTTGLVGFALRACIFSYLGWRHPDRADSYERRRHAAVALVRLFAGAAPTNDR